MYNIAGCLSLLIFMFVCLHKDNKQCCVATKIDHSPCASHYQSSFVASQYNQARAITTFKSFSETTIYILLDLGGPQRVTGTRCLPSLLFQYLFQVVWASKAIGKTYFQVITCSANVSLGTKSKAKD